MKTFTSILFYLLLLSSVFAQELPLNIAKRIEAADHYFANYEYHKAIEEYIEIDERMSLLNVKMQVAKCYKMIGELGNAIAWYEKALDNPSFSAANMREYAEALLANGNYEQARTWFGKSEDPLAANYLVSMENMNVLLKDSGYYKLKPFPYNTEDAEFSPSVYEGGVLFVSGGGKSVDLQAKQLDLYAVSMKGGAEPVKLDKNVNSLFSEGPSSYVPSTNTLYFTRTTKETPEIVDGEKVFQLGIFQATKTELGFDDLKPVGIPGAKSGSIGHPALNEAADKMYFAASIDGGKGGEDLWVSTKKKGKWGKPVNLGKDINTEGDELFPFVYQDSLLYFASNGHGGLGGLDVFKVNLNTNKVVNLGTPINSAYDDFGFILTPDKFSGFFSSNRPGGKGADDIYAFDYVKITLRGTVLDKNGNPLPGVDIKLSSHANNEYIDFKADENGRFEHPIKMGSMYLLELFNKGYHPHIQEIEVDEKRDYEVIILLPEMDEPQTIVVNEPKPDFVPPSNNKYKVQIGAKRIPMERKDLQERGYMGDLDIQYYQEDNWHKYAIGGFDTYAEAEELKKDCDVFDAFVVVFDATEKNKIATEFTLRQTARKD